MIPSRMPRWLLFMTEVISPSELSSLRLLPAWIYDHISSRLSRLLCLIASYADTFSISISPTYIAHPGPIDALCLRMDVAARGLDARCVLPSSALTLFLIATKSLMTDCSLYLVLFVPPLLSSAFSDTIGTTLFVPAMFRQLCSR